MAKKGYQINAILYRKNKIFTILMTFATQLKISMTKKENSESERFFKKLSMRNAEKCSSIQS